MDMNQLVSQIQRMATLYAEILVCIVAASLLGWIVGLMMRRSRSKRRLADTVQLWEERYKTLEETARVDAENLEEQLQSLANETKTLQATNRALTDTLKKNDTNTQKARAESIELNRQHTETHERLQRIIQQKDREILELGNRLNVKPPTIAGRSDAKKSKAKGAASTQRRAPAAIIGIADADLNNEDTIAISATQLDSDTMDATVQMAVPMPDARSVEPAIGPALTDTDESLDETSDLSGMGIEESTIAMDDEALAFAQRSYKSRGRD